MITRLYVVVVERAVCGTYHWAEVRSRDCVVVPTPVSGLSDDPAWQWWVERETP